VVATELHDNQTETTLVVHELIDLLEEELSVGCVVLVMVVVEVELVEDVEEFGQNVQDYPASWQLVAVADQLGGKDKIDESVESCRCCVCLADERDYLLQAHQAHLDAFSVRIGAVHLYFKSQIPSLKFQNCIIPILLNY